jgi:1-acyl-sn-glycerol-3-phosphate acyltransferase
MFSKLRSKQPDAPLGKLIYYVLLRWFFCIVSRIIYRAKAFDAHHVPEFGAVILAANHQSYLDPPMLTIRVPQRHLNFVAKEGLFKFKPFAIAIRGLNALPIRDDAGDLQAIKETVSRLNQGRAILIFPEGSRCPDGAVDKFKRGTGLLIKKAKCRVVPAAIEGAFDAWPIHKALPRLFGCRVYVKYGPPIEYEELMKAGSEGAMELVRQKVDVLRRELREQLRRDTKGKFPPRNAGDEPLRP